MNISDSIEKLEKHLSDRIQYQLKFAVKLNEAMEMKLDSVLNEAVEYLKKAVDEKGAVTKDDENTVESILSPFSKKAKSLKIICAGHAHIDMNWMWGYNETVAITIDTFRTMLDLMNEYNTFTFSQSQASVYRIVEEFKPEMIEEIKKRVHEGRWEITASTWVEADKNMTNEESQVRHMTNTRAYLTNLFDLPEGYLNFDYEPDTFGHHINVPEVLSKSGVKYYYHCRGYDGHILYNWKAPSGNSILVYKEPHWYNSAITPEMALFTPGFCKSHNMNVMLKVYGCGDHGGGPTRKDIELILKMNTWPVFPVIEMGRYKDFYEQAERNKDNYPVVEGELNFIFTGCYTSQSRIKAGNKISEARLYDYESAAAKALALVDTKPLKGSDEAWEKVLFNHFHDILPGSGVIETREYAMAKYQETLAFANTNTYESYRKISDSINSIGLMEDEDFSETRSEGAGAGFRTTDLKITSVERGKGIKRIYNVFNSLPFEKTQVIELTIWDWEGNPDKLKLMDSKGNKLPHQFVKSRQARDFDSRYWQHKYFNVLTTVTVPSLGYETIILDDSGVKPLVPLRPSDVRVEKGHDYILDNGIIRAEFNPDDMSLKSLKNLSNDIELIAPESQTGIFRYIKEDPSRGMTSWIIGKHMEIQPVTSSVRIAESHMDKDSLRQWITFTAEFSKSNIKVKVVLEKGNDHLDYNVECEWLEIGEKQKNVPLLDFTVQCAYDVKEFRYDVPFGTIDRAPRYMDVPALNICSTVSGKNPSLAVISDDKYGFRGYENSISLSLLRSSYDPDPHPELGIHKFKFAVAALSSDTSASILKKVKEYRNPLNYVSAKFSKGTLPLSTGLLDIKSISGIVSSVKPSEKTKGIIIRMFEAEGRSDHIEITSKIPVKKAYETDVYENMIKEINIINNAFSLTLEPNSIKTVLLEI